MQRTALILLESYDSDIPDNFEALISLPGVGPKMAHICMHVAWNVVTGIGADTHVHRIAHRLRWTQTGTVDADHTRAALEQWLPMDEWADFNLLMVGFGQTICTAKNPKCGSCLLADRCPSNGVKY